MGFLSKITDVFKSVKSIPVVGDVVSGLTGGLGSTASDYVSNAFIGQPNADAAFAQSQTATAKQYERQKELYQNRYKWTMEDMKRAGLNPILAASSGFNVGSNPTVSAAQSFMAPSPIGQGASSAKMVAETEKMKEETKETSAKIKKVQAETGLIIKKVKETIENTKVLSEESRNKALEYWNIAQDFHVKSHQINKMIAEVEELEQRSYLEHAEMQVANQKRAEIRIMIKKMRKEIERLELGNREYRQRKMAYSSEAGVVLAAFKEIMSSLAGKNP